ncbi:MAG: OmpH family outer membrane protein [Bacteroidales bacterium]|nr:OmpH family outer membrane protein [Bacteroidales bacterium]MDY2916210.1 OmpH family outer membrane protein [Muribaculaceae bacterium]
MAVALLLPAIAAAQKFGTIDVNAIFTAMPETTAAQTQLQEVSKKYEAEYKKLEEEVNKKVQEFQALAADTPQSIKDRRQQEIQELAQKVETFQNTASQDIQRQQQQLMAPIQQKITDAIKAVGQEGSYTFIFENGMAAFQGADVVDVTPAVKAKLGLK